MSSRAHAAWSLFVLLAAGTSACSLVGLATYDVAHCDDDGACPLLNQRDGIAETACVRWNCEPVSDLCVLGPRDADGDGNPDPACTDDETDCDDHEALRRPNLPEACDGLDNDCDLLIDEGDIEDVPHVELLSVTEPRGSYAPGADAEHATLLLTSSGRASFVDLGAASASLMELGSAATDATTGAPIPGDLCPAASGAAGTTPCDEVDAALDVRADGLAVVAMVSSLECRHGTLRVGMLDRTDGRVRHQGPADVADVFPALDTGDDCAGAIGVSHPAIALEDRGESALVVYLRASQTIVVGDCLDGFDFEVAATGVTLGDAIAPFSPVRVPVLNATSDRPTSLGRTGSFVRPALVAWPGVGWLVAFGQADGTLALRLVRRFELRDALEVVSLPSIPHAGGVGRIALALGGATTNGRALGVAALSTHDASGACVTIPPSTLHLIDVDPTSGVSAPIRDVALHPAAEVSLVHVDRGFVAAHDGAPESGGFLVLATDDADAWAHRITDDGAFDASERFELGDATRLPYVAPPAADGRVPWAFVRSSTVVTGTLLCARPR